MVCLDRRYFFPNIVIMASAIHEVLLFTEIVWIDTSFIEIPWGIPQSGCIPTKDGSIVGLSCDLKLKINDVKIFYNDVVAGTRIWRIQDLKEFYFGIFSSK